MKNRITQAKTWIVLKDIIPDSTARIRTEMTNKFSVMLDIVRINIENFLVFNDFMTQLPTLKQLNDLNNENLFFRIENR